MIAVFSQIKLLSKPVKVMLVVATDFIVAFLAWLALTSAAPSLKIFVVKVGSASGEFVEAGSFYTFIVSYAIMLVYLFYSGFGPFEAIVLIILGNQRCNQTKTFP